MQVVMSGSDLCGNMYNKQVLDIQFTNFINDSKICNIKLVRCPKWLFVKFNILEFKRGEEQGSQIRCKNAIKSNENWPNQVILVK